MRRFIVIVLYNVIGLVELLILIRALFKVLGANPEAKAVSLLYSSTDFLLTPLAGIFPSFNIPTGGVIDAVAISGMILYLVAFMIILKVFKIVFRTQDFI